MIVRGLICVFFKCFLTLGGIFLPFCPILAISDQNINFRAYVPISTFVLLAEPVRMRYHLTQCDQKNVFHIMVGRAILRGPGSDLADLWKIGTLTFCILWTYKLPKTQKIENEHENRAKVHDILTHYTVPSYRLTKPFVFEMLHEWQEGFWAVI